MTGRRNRHKWAFDLCNKTSGIAAGEFQLPSPDLDSPVAYNEKAISRKDEIATKESRAVDIERLTVKKSWDIALAPIKQIPMNLFMMWMSGNTISIFPIMMVGMMVFRPIQAILNSQTLNAIQGSQAPLQKLMYITGNGACILLALYKCQSMGLLPTHPSDWLAFEDPQQRVEWSGGGMML